MSPPPDTVENSTANNFEFEPASLGMEKLGAAACLSAILLSCLGLIGWISGREILASIHPRYIPMAPATAVCIGVIGFAWLFHPSRASNHVHKLLCLSGIILAPAFGALDLLEWSGLIRFDVEALFFPEPSFMNGIPLARVSPLSSALFILTGAAMLCGVGRSISVKGHKFLGNFSGLFGSVVVFAGFTLLLGYVYGAPLLYGMKTIPVAATTALSFLFLGIAVLARLKPDDFPNRYFTGDSVNGRLVRVFVPLVFLAALLQGIAGRLAPMFVEVNDAVISALIAGTVAILAVILTSKAASVVGGAIDQAHQAVQESEQRFRAIFDNHHAIMLIIDPDTGMIEDGSPGACAFYGYSRDELRKKNITEINVLAPQQIFEVMEDAKSRRRKYFEFPHRLADGTTRDVEVCSGPVVVSGKTLLFSVIGDVTKRKQAEEALRKSEERYRIVADFTEDWEFWISSAKQFLYVSPSCERTTGYTVREFLSDPGLFENIVHPDDRARVVKHIDDETKSSDLIAQSLDFRIVCRNGDIRWINHVCRAVYGDNGAPLGRRASNREITDRKRIEEEREKLVAELQYALTNVKQLSGMLPICASCKKIRDDSGYWSQIENYIRDHSEAEFSHSICPECAKRLYPEFLDDDLSEKT